MKGTDCCVFLMGWNADGEGHRSKQKLVDGDAVLLESRNGACREIGRDGAMTGDRDGAHRLFDRTDRTGVLQTAQQGLECLFVRSQHDAGGAIVMSRGQNLRLRKLIFTE